MSVSDNLEGDTMMDDAKETRDRELLETITDLCGTFVRETNRTPRDDWQEESEALRHVVRALERDKELLRLEAASLKTELCKYAQYCAACGVWFEHRTKCDCGRVDC